MKPLLLLVALLVAAMESATAADRPSVLLVTLDTTRADRMGFLGSPRGVTPQLDLLAKESVVFERAYAQAPITTVSHATVLSGTFPQFHKVNDFGVPLPAALPYLPALLKAEGYRTAAFVGSLILDPRNGLAPGFDRGFEVYDAGFKVRRGKESRYDTMERRAGEVVSRALAWLAANANGGAPFLLWVHLYDAHDPYDPPEPWKSRFAKAPYDGEIAYVDAMVGKLVAGLRAAQQLERTAVLVLADHGESLGEHGESTHGAFLYDSTLHVPLLIRLPGHRHAGRRVAARVSLVDLLPTVLEITALDAQPAAQGQSLLPLLTAAKAADRASYAETDYPKRAFGWSSLAAWRIEKFLFVKAPRRELYEIATDPSSARNLALEQGEVANRIQEQMEAFRAKTGGSVVASPETTLDPALLERLAALGYVSGAGSPVASPATSGIDPKDRIGVANTLHEAIVSVEGGEFARAATLLGKVVASDPQIQMAQLQLGLARARQRQFADALAPLRKAIEMQPDNPVAHYEMGLCLFETGDWKTSAGHFEIVVSRMPKFADARFSLGSVYARIDRVPEAMKELRAALDLEPQHYRANLLLGRLLTLLGQPAAGLPHLERAASKEPDSSEAQAFLGDAYDRLGRKAESARARARAQQLRRPGAP
jgi:arylsulfatase A-like enzyme/Tfp pilus assembly protein PilF